MCGHFFQFKFESVQSPSRGSFARLETDVSLFSNISPTPQRLRLRARARPGVGPPPPGGGRYCADRAAPVRLSFISECPCTAPQGVLYPVYTTTFGRFFSTTNLVRYYDVVHLEFSVFGDTILYRQAQTEFLHNYGKNNTFCRQTSG